MIVDVSALRIVDQDLWDAVKARQDADGARLMEAGSDGGGRPSPQGLRRKRYLLSGLLACGLCAGKLTIAGPAGRRAYYCANLKEKGESVCVGMPGIRQDEVERLTLAGLRGELMQPEAVAQFRKAYARHFQSARAEQSADIDIARAELRQVDLSLARLTEALKHNPTSRTLGASLAEDEARKLEIEGRIASLDVELPQLPENLAELYQQAVDRLAATLSDQTIVQRASEILAKMLDRIIVHPLARGGHELQFEGKLVGLLGFADGERAEAYEASARLARGGCGGRIWTSANNLQIHSVPGGTSPATAERLMPTALPRIRHQWEDGD